MYGGIVIEKQRSMITEGLEKDYHPRQGFSGREVAAAAEVAETASASACVRLRTRARESSQPAREVADPAYVRLRVTRGPPVGNMKRGG